MVGGVSDYKSLKVDSVMVCALDLVREITNIILFDQVFGLVHKGIVIEPVGSYILRKV